MLPAGFNDRKAKILQQLAVPDADYSDASPKGSVDEGIRPLLEHVNAAEGFVTTSSCAGRVSVFVEGRKVAATPASEGEPDAAGGGAAERLAGVGGKGGGGTWLYVSHDPHTRVGEDNVDWVEELKLGSSRGASQDCRGAFGKRLIHFKFEPMVSSSHALNKPLEMTKVFPFSFTCSANNPRSYTSSQHLTHTPSSCYDAHCTQASANPEPLA